MPQDHANCFFVPWYEEGDIWQGAGRRRITAIAIHAARPIIAGEELTLHYGNAYRRNYSCGLPPLAPLPTKRNIRSASETPAAWLTVPGLVMSQCLSANAWHSEE